MLVLEMADDRLDRSAAPEVALDGLGEPSLLARDIDPEALLLRRVVARSRHRRRCVEARRRWFSMSGITAGQRVAIVGIARQRLHMGDELAALAAVERRGDGP